MAKDNSLFEDDSVQSGSAQQPVMPSFDQIPEAKPDKKVRIKVFAVIVAVLVLAAVAFFVFGFAKKLFMSDKDYFAYVERQSASDFSEIFSVCYDGYLLNDILKDNVYNVRFSPALGSDLKESLQAMYGSQADIDWLDDLEFDFTLNVNGNQMAEDLLVGIGGQRVLSTFAVCDLESAELLLTFQEITDDVLKFDLGGAGGKLDALLDILNAENRKKAADVLPTASEVKNLITKYHGLVIDGIENVTGSSQEITVEGITQTFSVYRATVSEKTLRNILLTVLEELQKDPDAKKILENTDCADTVRDKIEEVKAWKAGEKTVMTVCDYVDSDDVIAGRKIEKDGREFMYLTVKDGSRFAAEYIIDGRVLCTANGTKKDNRITGEYVFKKDGETLYKIGLTDFDQKALENGVIDGKICFSPNGDAISAMVPEAYRGIASMLNIAFEMEGTGNFASGQFTLAVLNGNLPLLTVDTQYSVTSAEVIRELSGKVVDVDINRPHSLQNVLSDLHLDQLIDNLRKTSLPQSYVDSLDRLNRQLQREINISGDEYAD